MLLAQEFDPALLKEAHALFTAHRDVRDVLLSLSQAGLSLYVMEAVTLCDGGCNPMWWRL